MSLINLIEFKTLGDDRGSLISLEQNKNIPFEIKRIYYIFGTKENVSRGFHAHRNLQQVAVCLSGSCRFVLDNGEKREDIILNSPDKGLYISNYMWREMHDFSPDCVLIVLASDFYLESDYIRNYDDFMMACKNVYSSIK
ncbi:MULTISPECIES: FdtA/QdtA family cupin domain-containing protein [Morganella]|uniref:sugar 3,4-ketoisomerase n=1 Tax=Morganella TaxID=581 RepID=UPI00277CF963|nr:MULTISPECIES: FdtA/QdtA family cupin domain-containing protein [unclassified Morganella (in: enterobacteria)]ELB1546482.1 FdtA/QdtA family cupin domain-containing protein [Morganella morganii]BEP19295.1 FdtA/QdtA family cupin domain-containing protein [Morganella morganii subsp. sibonii]HDS6844475.1 FdtA/QdtA family cupin domain-containing protein [Morganella morganii subsp. morganii]HDU8311226.1 FdtA/QdtA family cupin domain-containing protein [Morganella morganii subsp. sibonii]